MGNNDYYIPKEDRLYGTCTLRIRIENEEQFEDWKMMNGGKYRWDFLTSYPAIMSANFDFHTSIDVDILVREVIKMLQEGFDVQATNWKLKEFESQLEREK